MEINRHVITTILACAALMLAGIALNVSLDVENKSDKQEQIVLTLCAWHDSMLAEIDAGWLFLEEHPEGTESISKEIVEKHIENLRTTIDLISPHMPSCQEFRKG